jgi:hypothetical protein
MKKRVEKMKLKLEKEEEASRIEIEAKHAANITSMKQQLETKHKQVSGWTLLERRQSFRAGCRND